MRPCGPEPCRRPDIDSRLSRQASRQRRDRFAAGQSRRPVIDLPACAPRRTDRAASCLRCLRRGRGRRRSSAPARGRVQREFAAWEALRPLARCGAAAPPSPAITATTAPTGATAPASTRISASTPPLVDGTSIDTLSVSISNRLSPGFTGSPTVLNQVVILPSATVSPSCGIRTSIAVPADSLFSSPPRLRGGQPRTGSSRVSSKRSRRAREGR